MWNARTNKIDYGTYYTAFQNITSPREDQDIPIFKAIYVVINGQDGTYYIMKQKRTDTYLKASAKAVALAALRNDEHQL